MNEARPQWRWIAALFLLYVSAIPLKLLTPVPIKIGIDSVIEDKPLPGPIESLFPDTLTNGAGGLLMLAAGLLLGITVLQYAHAMGIWLLHTWVGQKLLVTFRAKLFRHLQRLSLRYHADKGSGDSVYRVLQDAPSIQWVAIDGLVPFLTDLLMIAAMIGVIVALDITIACVAVAVAPVLFVLARRSSRRLRDEWDQAKRVETRALNIVQETVGALQVVKAFGREDTQLDRFVDASVEGSRKQMRVARLKGSFDLAVGATIGLGSAATLYLGVRHVLDGSLTLGNLLVITTYLTQLFGPMERISKKIADLQSSVAGAQRAFELLDEEPDVAESPNARPIARARGEITLRGVGYGYKPGVAVLSGVDLKIEPGQSVGIVGQTGAGKTTFVGLLMRFFDVTEGAVLIDGQDIRDLKVADLRNQFAMVLQEPVLFSTSIYDNIAYARPEADREQVMAAAKAAHAHDFILRMPDGYDTMVGERGLFLSGGERQRIALARAFLKDAPILILDEPTSAVDNDTESLIMDAVERLMQNRTTLMIAHRTRTLTRCDRILRVEGGKITDSDPESELGMAAPLEKTSGE
jgi:ATP-binding cassette subfamily B protein